MGSVVKTTLNLPKDEIEALKRLAGRRMVPVTHAFRQAIQTELFVQDLVDQGRKLLVQDEVGELQQVIFTQTRVSAAPSVAGQAR